MKPFVLDEPVNGTFFPELSDINHGIGDFGTGYFNVALQDSDRSTIGYTFRYFYTLGHKNDFTSKSLTSISLAHLRRKVLDAGLEWKIIDVDAAHTTLLMNTLDLHQRNRDRAKKLLEKGYSGVMYVIKTAYGDTYRWKYTKYVQDTQPVQITAMRILDLKKKVEERNLPWIVVAEDLYNDIIKKERFIT